MNKKGGLFKYIFWIIIGMILGVIASSIYLKDLIC